jgi:hypothetical protein
MSDEAEYLTRTETAERLRMKHSGGLDVLERNGLFPRSVLRSPAEGKRALRVYPREIAEAAIALWNTKQEAHRRLKELAQLTAAPAAQSPTRKAAAG